MKKALRKETFRSIGRTKARFISIIAIVALGISFFAGMKATEPDMKETASLYYEQSNLMDIRVISPVGLTDEDIEALAEVDGVETVAPGRFVDGILKVDGKSIGDIDGSEMTCRAISIDFDEAQEFQETGSAPDDYMNRITLLEGEWPDQPNECVVDGSALSAPEQFQIGQTVTLEGDGSDITDDLNVTEFKIVGIIRTPLYLSFERGNTTIGSGKLGSFMYVSDEVFNFDYYTEAFINVAGADNYEPYTEEYTDFIAPVLTRIEELESVRLPLRVQTIRTETEPKVLNGETELAAQEAAFNQQIADAEAQLEQLHDVAENGEADLEALKEQFNNSLTDAQRELLTNTDEYNSSYREWIAKKNELEEAKVKLKELEQARSEYSANELLLRQAEQQIKSSQEDITQAEELIAQARAAMDYFNALQDGSVENLEDWIEQSGLPAEQLTQIVEAIKRLTAMGTAEDMIAFADAQLQQYEKELEASKQELAAAQAEYDESKQKLDEAAAEISKYDGLDEQIAQAEQELDAAERELDAGNSDLKMGQLELNVNQQQLQNQISLAETQLADALEKAETADADFAAQKAEGEQKLADARADLKAAQDLLASLDTASWMIQDRDDQPGYTSYGQTAERMGALAQVFPIFFFLVAALVCLTTMTRMVEEERTQLGTLKALGYSNGAIVSKYLIYSLTASLLGSVIGLALGFYIFPKAIFAAWGIMYDYPSCVINFEWRYALIGTLVSLLATTAAAIFACRKELREKPAKLMRPKAPKAGKRILLERIGFIWSHLNFTSKVTARNLFRNKKRFITTLIGVTGCTALLLTGFGLGDSISAIMDRQFGDEGVSKYDVQIVLSEEQSLDNGEPAIMQTIRSRSEIKRAMMTHMDVIDGTSERTDSVLEINLLVPENSASLAEFVKMENRKTKEAVALDDSGVVITEKFAEDTETEIGDDIIIIDANGEEHSVPVSGIVENYTFHYVYMSPALYEQTFGEEATFNYVMGILADSVDEAQKDTFATDMMKESGINAVAYTTQIMDTFSNIVNSLNLVVIVFIIAAGALAFVVLYNLANINLNERIREVATIKVLGFRDKEVSSYIIRENIILTVIGIILGLVLGIFLHQYVISLAEIDIVMFGRTIQPWSYVFAALLSLLFSTLVNLIMHRKLKKVNMVDSLKAVE